MGSKRVRNFVVAKCSEKELESETPVAYFIALLGQGRYSVNDV